MDGYNVNPNKIDDGGVTPFPEGDLHLIYLHVFVSFLTGGIIRLLQGTSPTPDVSAETAVGKPPNVC